MPKDYDHDWRHKDDEWDKDYGNENYGTDPCSCSCRCPLKSVGPDGLCGYCVAGYHYDESTPL